MKKKKEVKIKSAKRPKHKKCGVLFPLRLMGQGNDHSLLVSEEITKDYLGSVVSADLCHVIPCGNGTVSTLLDFNTLCVCFTFFFACKTKLTT